MFETVPLQFDHLITDEVYTHFHFDHCGGDVHPMLLGQIKIASNA